MELNVVCVKWGSKFDAKYVNRLYAAVERNLSLEHRFVCFTDDPQWIDTAIETHPIPQTDLKSCWTKLALFSDRLPLQGVMLYLDLDNLVTGSLDGLFLYQRDATHMGLIDWNRPYTFASGIFRLHVGAYPHVLKNFYRGLEEGWLQESIEYDAYSNAHDKVVYWDSRPSARIFAEEMNLNRAENWVNDRLRYPGDQEWISNNLHYPYKKSRLRLSQWPPKWLLSFKHHGFVREDTKVLLMHGYPKQHDIPDHELVRRYWC